jgi:hypothetical protein
MADDVSGPGPGGYDHHPMVGFVDHDCTKWREPNYTLRPKTPDLKCMIIIRMQLINYTAEKYRFSRTRN